MRVTILFADARAGHDGGDTFSLRFRQQAIECGTPTRWRVKHLDGAGVCSRLTRAVGVPFDRHAGSNDHAEDCLTNDQWGCMTPVAAVDDQHHMIKITVEFD